MPTISLLFPSVFNNSPFSSFFSPTTTTTATTTITDTVIPQRSSPPRPPLHETRTMDAVELRRVFEMFDQNGDGRISVGELTASLENMGIAIPDADLAHMIGRIDSDGDGCVDGDEFEALYRLIMEERGNDVVDEEEDMREAFNVFDKNGDGFISVDELRAVLGSLGLGQGRSLEDCKLMIMKVDVDGDGRVSFKEFKKMMKEGGFASLST